jgi:hypothetical protein
MADYKILLRRLSQPFYRQWQQRKYRYGLICFFDSLTLYLKAGFSLSYSWPETLRALEETFSAELLGDLRGPKTESWAERDLGGLLLDLKNNCRNVSYRMWFGILWELYSSGAQLTHGVEAVTTALRREQEREFEMHCRALPTKVNIVLILFFLPPTFLWLFIPLILEILSQFK